jgi:hypothetical protein
MINGKGEISKRSFDLPGERGSGIGNHREFGLISTVFISYWHGFDFCNKTARVLVPSTAVRPIVGTGVCTSTPVSPQPGSTINGPQCWGNYLEFSNGRFFSRRRRPWNPIVFLLCKQLPSAVPRKLSMRSKRPTSCRLLARRTSELLEEIDIESMTSGDALPVRSFSGIAAESRAMQEHYRAKEDQWPTDP